MVADKPVFQEKRCNNFSFPTWPQYDEAEEKILMEVLHSGVWWKTPGEQVYAFEREFAQFIGVDYAIGVTNGTAALEVAVSALGIRPGDEVIVPDFTFVATASAVLSVGAMPIFVDVNPDTYCINAEEIQKAVTSRTKAVIVVHLGGHPVDLDAILDLCRSHHLYLIEDCSHAHGSEWRGKKVGGFGDFGTFSFQQGKLLTAGEGGAIVTNNADLELKARSIHDCGRLPDQWFYSHFNYGSNYRMTEWQGAILRKQLERLPDQGRIRNRNAAYLDRELEKIKGITPQWSDPNCTHNGHYAYIFHYDSEKFSSLPLTQFVMKLEEAGIPIQASYPPLHELDLFQNGIYRSRITTDQDYQFLMEKDYPHTVKGARETIWFPQNVLLAEEYILDQMVHVMRETLNKEVCA
ncbi:MAG: hypothetical protein CL609_09280 [Anaerolineaceae bacterium]|nr:hypothetical protein [Anaerolineaceae bacterium]